jgi:5-methylcytosine-specific restriction protein A
MSTFLLSWNPTKSPWEGLGDEIALLNKKGKLKRRWSVGNSKSVTKGDRFFLIRLGKKPRGIFGSGVVCSEIYQDEHWQDARKTTLYCELDFDVLRDSDSLLPMKLLTTGKLKKQLWSPRQTCISIREDVTEELEALWANFVKKNPSDRIGQHGDEEQNFVSYVEGSQTKVYSTKYERDPRLRSQAMRLHGTTCMECGFNFGDVYGEWGNQYIHVHHVRPLSNSGKVHVNPRMDLIVLCANCHAMVHRKRNKTLSLRELIELIKANAQ